MKKKVLAGAACLLALGVMCYVGRLWAQATPAPAAPAAAAPRTKIALLNLTYVIKNYEKYIGFQKEIQGLITPFQKTDDDLRKKMEEMGKTPPASDKRAEVERQLKDLQRKRQDNSDEAKLVLGKKSDEQMKILYLDVLQAAQGYASGHDFDLVLHYNDAVTPEDYFSPMNIARKVQTGALMPLYAASGMDISKEVVTTLNYNLRPATTQGGAATGAPSGGQQ